MLASNVAGNIVDIRGYPGDAFESGQVLILVDDRSLKKQVAAIQAELDSANKEFLIREKTFQPYKKLYHEKSVPD